MTFSRVQSSDDRISVGGNSLKIRLFQISVRHGGLLGQGAQPPVQRDFLEFRRDRPCLSVDVCFAAKAACARMTRRAYS
jgi:hypothetical protein